MRIVPHWLQEHCAENTSGSRTCFAQALEALGHEIEPIPSPYDTCVVVEIIAVAPHPSLSRLSVCTIYDGSRTVKVVCGAPNVQKGMRVIWAQVGTSIQGTVLGVRDFGGVLSPGMLCGAQELEFFQQGEGLWALPDAKVGQSLTEVLQWHNIAEIELTPNRGDLLSMRGLARESAILGPHITFGSAAFTAHSALFDSFIPWPGTVRWNALRRMWWWEITGVRAVVPSLAMMARLRQAGMKIHGHIADVVNYVMLEFGYPMHVFSGCEPSEDWSFSPAYPQESWTALDGRSYTLDETTGVLRHGEKVRCVPGVMGSEEFSYHRGEDRAIIEIVDQSFPGAPRLMMSDARTRLDRGVDTSVIPLAISRLHTLLQQLAPQVQWGRRWTYKSQDLKPSVPRVVSLRPSAVKRLTGVDLAPSRMLHYLNALGFAHQESGAGLKHAAGSALKHDTLCVEVPPWRHDIGGEEDLVEEVLRCHGFSHITAQPWVSGSITPGKKSLHHMWRSYLGAENYYEVVNWSFASEAQGQATAEPFRKLSHPLRQDQTILRPRLWPALLEVLGQHCSRHTQRYPLFERGPIFPAQGPEEMVWSGVMHQEPTGTWQGNMCDVYTAKTHLLSLLSLGGIRVQDLEEHSSEVPWLHPGRSAAVWYNGQCLGHWGDLHPKLTADFTHAVSMWEVYEARLPKRPTSFQPFVWHTLQPIVKDLGFVMPYHQPVGPMVQALSQKEEGYCVPSICIFDVFSDENRWGREKKSVALRLTWRPQSAWTQKEIHAHMDVCIRRAEKFQAILRRDEEAHTPKEN